jgi:hypothetical protein
VGPGTATLTVSLRGGRVEMPLRVYPFPTTSADLVIDSFRVVEYAACAPRCPYRAYVPLVWMRQPDGTSAERIQVMEFTVPTLSMTMNFGFYGLSMSPGGTHRVNACFDPYLWNNDFFLVDLDGPVPDGLATLRVIVSDEQGQLQFAQATAPIERDGTPPLVGSGGGC